MRDEEKENLFKALSEVKDLMQREDAPLHQSQQAPKFSIKDEEVLELAGHEIGDTNAHEDNFDQVDEMKIEDFFAESEDDRIDEIILSAGDEDSQNISCTSKNKIKEMLEGLELGSGKGDQPFVLEEIVEQTAKPYILKWLDQNLESVVREVVEVEVAKIMKRVKK